MISIELNARIYFISVIIIFSSIQCKTNNKSNYNSWINLNGYSLAFSNNNNNSNSDLLKEENDSHYISFGGKYLTTLSGSPATDKINVLTAGKRGPVLLEGIQFLQEVSHFTREKIPERIVHAKGTGAFGYFEATNPLISSYCRASFMAKTGKITKIAVRFSTVVGSKGSPDTVRDPRGFAIRFYTDEGNFDLLTLNFPVFFLRDPIRFINFIHSQRTDPQSTLFNYDAYWDFISLLPETLHGVSYLFSDIGIPDGYRHMNGFSINVFKLINSKGEVVLAKFHLLTMQGIKNLSDAKAKLLAGLNPDYATEDLFNAINSGFYPSWKVCIQVMTIDQAEKWPFSPFDNTKLWPQNLFPIIEIGKIFLTENPTNHFAQIEQIAFDPSSVVNGIEFSTDKVLQGRLFAYRDAHLYRLGTNFYQLPVNLPIKPLVIPNLRDGQSCHGSNYGGGPNYYPNSFYDKKTDNNFKSRWSLPPASEIQKDDTTKEDNYSQVKQFWESLDEEDKITLINNLARHISNAKAFIRKRFIAQIRLAHPEYGERLRKAIENHLDKKK